MERYPNLKEEVGGSFPGCEISSLHDRNLALACRPSVSRQKDYRLAKFCQTNILVLDWRSEIDSMLVSVQGNAREGFGHSWSRSF